MSGSRPARESLRGDIAAGVSLQKKKKATAELATCE